MHLTSFVAQVASTDVVTFTFNAWKRVDETFTGARCLAIVHVFLHIANEQQTNTSVVRKRLTQDIQLLYILPTLSLWRPLLPYGHYTYGAAGAAGFFFSYGSQEERLETRRGWPFWVADVAFHCRHAAVHRCTHSVHTYSVQHLTTTEEWKQY